MTSSRRIAHLGLVAMTLVLVLSLGSLTIGHLRSLFSKAEVGKLAPRFALRDVGGHDLELSSLKGKVVVMYFASPRCPVSNDYAERIVELSKQYGHDHRVQFLAVDTAEASLDEVRVQAAVLGQPYPTLRDEQGSVARRYGVKATPTFFVIDPNGVVRYEGSFDDSRDAKKVQHRFVAEAVRGLLENEPLSMSNAQSF